MHLLVIWKQKMETNANSAGGRLIVISQIHSLFFPHQTFCWLHSCPARTYMFRSPCRLACPCSDMPASGRGTEVSVPLPGLVLRALSLYSSKLPLFTFWSTVTTTPYLEALCFFGLEYWRIFRSEEAPHSWTTWTVTGKT